jgi:hypothetical protein
MVDMFCEGLEVYEAVEVEPGDLRGVHAGDLCPMAFVNDIPQSRWHGPMSQQNIEHCHIQKDIFVGGFGDKHPKKNRKRTFAQHIDIAKKYVFYCKLFNEEEQITMWHYEHCSGSHDLLIRRVEPSPEIHLVMSPFGAHKVRGVWQGDTSWGTRVTAVAGNGKCLVELIVEEDVRFHQFRQDVQKHCVAENLCTMQTYLTVFYENLPMTGRMFLRKAYEHNTKVRLPNVICVMDSLRCYEAFTPQSLQALGDDDDASDVASTSLVYAIGVASDEEQITANAAVAKKQRTAVAERIAKLAKTAQRIAKKQRTAVADASHRSSISKSSDSTNLYGRPVARPSAIGTARPSMAPYLMEGYRWESPQSRHVQP